MVKGSNLTRVRAYLLLEILNKLHVTVVVVVVIIIIISSSSSSSSSIVVLYKLPSCILFVCVLFLFFSCANL
jgi:hypothetical protein